MIELADGWWISPEQVALIKPIDDEQCLLFLAGQSALEGHVLPWASGEVAEVINDYLDIDPEYEDETEGEGTGEEE